MELLEALNWRYAVKQFSEDIIPDAVIADLIRATSLTPSCYGLQPYQIIQVNDRSVHEKLLAHSWGQDKVVEWAHRQAYIALGNLLTSAAVSSVDTCPVEGIDPAGFDEVLGLQARHLAIPLIRMSLCRCWLVRIPRYCLLITKTLSLLQQGYSLKLVML